MELSPFKVPALMYDVTFVPSLAHVSLVVVPGEMQVEKQERCRDVILAPAPSVPHKGVCLHDARGLNSQSLLIIFSCKHRG